MHVHTCVFVCVCVVQITLPWLCSPRDRYTFCIRKVGRGGGANFSLCDVWRGISAMWLAQSVFFNAIAGVWLLWCDFCGARFVV